MPRCLAFLRAVNVGGRQVKMDALCSAFEELGLAAVSTFIASGNVRFDTKARSLPALERKIEAHLLGVFGFEIDTFVRTQAELAAIATHEAFDAKLLAGAKTHVVGFMHDEPDAAARRAIAAFESDADHFVLHGRELHWASGLRQSESTFSNAIFERALKLRATFRSITTVRKLAGAPAPG
jgi:uncharacterized protein (DUF1697 family)